VCLCVCVRVCVSLPVCLLVYLPKNGEIALQTPRTSRLLDCQYYYSTKRSETETLLILLLHVSWYTLSDGKSSAKSTLRKSDFESEVKLVHNDLYGNSKGFYYTLGEPQPKRVINAFLDRYLSVYLSVSMSLRVWGSRWTTPREDGKLKACVRASTEPSF